MQVMKTEMHVRVTWPSKEVDRKLPEGFDSLAMMLVRETHEKISTAAWKNEKLRKEFGELIKKEINKKCTHLCSKKNPSNLRMTSKKTC